MWARRPPRGDASATEAEERQAALERTAQLRRLSMELYGSADYRAAATAAGGAVALQESILGPRHADMLPVLHALVNNLASFGQSTEARGLCEGILKIVDGTSGPEPLNLGGDPEQPGGERPARGRPRTGPPRRDKRQRRAGQEAYAWAGPERQDLASSLASEFEPLRADDKRFVGVMPRSGRLTRVGLGPARWIEAASSDFVKRAQEFNRDHLDWERLYSWAGRVPGAISE